MWVRSGWNHRTNFLCRIQIASIPGIQYGYAADV